MSRSDDRALVWGDARRVLCVRLDNLGDVLMTAPAIRALRAASRERHVTLLASPSGAEAACMLPGIDATIAYDAPWMKSKAPLRAARDLDMRDTLAAGRFDAAVIFTVYSQSPLPAATLCYLAGIPLRVAHCRENPYGLLTDWIPETEPASTIRHEVRRQLDLVTSVGASCSEEAMRIVVPSAARAAMRRTLRDMGIGSRDRLIVLHPGATAPSRTYPADRFADVARILVQRTDATIVVTGSSDERALARSVAATGCERIVNGAGRFTLPELSALIERAALLVSNNTGPVHIASSVGTPVVDLYALTNPQHTPWHVPHRVLFHDVACRYCYKSVCPEGHNLCLRGVTVDDVVAAAFDLLDGAAGSAVAMPTRAARVIPQVAAS